MKTFSTLSAIVALLWSTSAAASRVVIMPEDIDRCVAEAKHERQSQCGGFQPGSLEYNKCMANWTDRVIQCYPRDAPLSPRQVADRNAEEARGSDFHNEANRLQDMPLVRHREEDDMMEHARPVDRMMLTPHQPPMPQRPQAMPMEHNNNMQRQLPPPQNQRQTAPHPPPFMQQQQPHPQQQQQPAGIPPPPPLPLPPPPPPPAAAAAAVIKDKPQQSVGVPVPVMTKPATGKQEPIKPALPPAPQNPVTMEDDSDIDEVPMPQAPVVQAKPNNNDMAPVTVTTTVNGASPAPVVVKSAVALAPAPPIDTVVVQEETTQMVLQAPPAASAVPPAAPPVASAAPPASPAPAPPAASAAPPVAAKPQTTATATVTPIIIKPPPPPPPPQTTSVAQSSDIPTPLSPEQMGMLQASIANNHANALKEASLAVTAALSSAAQSANNLSASARAAIAPAETAVEDPANAEDDDPMVIETTTTTVVVPAVATAPLPAGPAPVAAAPAVVNNESNVTAVATATATLVMDREGVSVGPVDNIIPENNSAVPSLAGIVGGTQVPQAQEQSSAQPDPASTSFAQVKLTTIGNAVVPVDTNIFSAREEVETNSAATSGVVSDDSDNESDSVSSPAAPAPALTNSSPAFNTASNTTSTAAAISSSSDLADSAPSTSDSSSATISAAALKSAADAASTSDSLLNTSPILVDVASSASAQSNSAMTSESAASVSSSEAPGKISLGKNTYLPVAKALGISKKPASTSSMHSFESSSDTARLGMMKNKMADSAAAPNAHTASVSGVAVAMLVGLVVANGNSLF